MARTSKKKETTAAAAPAPAPVQEAPEQTTPLQEQEAHLDPGQFQDMDDDNLRGLARDLGLDPQKVNDSYAMSEIARQFEMGKNPTSKTNMLRTLQMVVTAMLGEGYKATSHDVNFLLSVYSRKNRKALVVSCANHRNFRAYIAEVCHRIVTGKEYELEYKTKREG